MFPVTAIPSMSEMFFSIAAFEDSDALEKGVNYLQGSATQLQSNGLIILITLGNFIAIARERKREIM